MLSGSVEQDRCLAGRMAMHACQIGATDTVPPCPGSSQRACVLQRGAVEQDMQTGNIVLVLLRVVSEGYVFVIC